MLGFLFVRCKLYPWLGVDRHLLPSFIFMYIERGWDGGNKKWIQNVDWETSRDDTTWV